jgi:hypothetical protein
MRVNARFEGVAEQQVEYLAKATNSNVSEVLRLSVDAFYKQLRGQTPSLRNFGKHVGRYSLARDTSRRYKELVSDAVDAKHSRPES